MPISPRTNRAAAAFATLVRKVVVVGKHRCTWCHAAINRYQSGMSVAKGLRETCGGRDEPSE